MSATLNSIPASWIVDVTPNVLSAGGTALDLNGLFLSQSARVPVGIVLSFPTPVAVADYFGSTSDEYAAAVVYFNGFTNSNKKPGALLFAQFNLADVGAFLRGGNVSGLTLAQLQALAGVLTVTIDGTPVTSSAIDLSAATSFSNASQIITEALATTGPTQATGTGKVGASFTASIATTVLTVTAMAGSPAGIISVGDTVVGAGVTANTTITSLGTGTGGTGTYNLSASQTVSSESMTVTSTKLTISAVATGMLAIGQEVTGSGVAVGTFITALGTGTGGTGTYTISDKQTVASTGLTMVRPTVTYDSQSGGFLVVSGTTGVASTIGYGSGTISAGLGLTAAVGAVTSQGADAIASTDAAGAMNAIAAQTQNWATFLSVGDLDASGFAMRLALAAWTNGQNNRFAFIAKDTDIAATESSAATASLGYAITSAEYSGTILVWQPAANVFPYSAFFSGWAASLDFDETQGRATQAFKSQTGVAAAVTNQTAADNLIANGYNFYAAVATANDRFLFAYPGSISGSFLWSDTFIDQIQLNAQLQLALLVLLTQVKRIAYNRAGYALIAAACMDPILQALNFGTITPGVTLSESQKAQVNNAAGRKIDDVLSTRGWFLLVQDATPQVRAARGSPPCTLWYMDGGAVQKIALTSVAVQ